MKIIKRIKRNLFLRKLVKDLKKNSPEQISEKFIIQQVFDILIEMRKYDNE